MGNNFFIAIRVLPVELLVHEFNGLCCKLTEIGLIWVESMTSSVPSFAYFTYFSNLNISGTRCRYFQTVNSVIIFPGILCDKRKKSRDKNLIIVALEVFIHSSNGIFAIMYAKRHVQFGIINITIG